MVMSTITCPDISIVIPAYNAQHHIVDQLGDIMRANSERRYADYLQGIGEGT